MLHILFSIVHQNFIRLENFLGVYMLHILFSICHQNFIRLESFLRVKDRDTLLTIVFRLNVLTMQNFDIMHTSAL